MEAMNAFESPFSFKGSSLTSLFLAAVLPLLFLKVLFFFNHTWPNFLYSLVMSRLNRQIATAAQRVRPNRAIQDDVMIQSIMGYVSYCYMRSLQQNANNCDAVAEADYEYTFIYENNSDFHEDWIPFSTRFDSLFGRVIASAMELSVLPSIGQAIQVEPGLFVRPLEDKHAHASKGEQESEQEEGSDTTGHRPNAGDGGSAQQDHAAKLNQFIFHDMRKYAEDMDEHPEPAADGKDDEASSVARPFDAPAQRKRREPGKHNSNKSESTVYDMKAVPPEDRFLVIEYRRPLPYERAGALCNSSNTGGEVSEYDASRAAGDVIDNFLSRAYGWYLGHMAQGKVSPLMAVYPSPALTLFGKFGTNAFSAGRSSESKFQGRCYVLDSSAPAEAGAADVVSSTTTIVKVTDGAAAASGSSAPSTTTSTTPTAPSTVAGGRIGLRGAAQTCGSMGKTFRSLFFPNKAHVLSVIDDFVAERGCFGVPGVVPRLNFFLHGAPGTGKTSFVKALARHLRRNLVVISMSEIVTVNELSEFLQPFDLEHAGRHGRSSVYSVRPHQSIYVFEDFDAIGDAWQALMKHQRERKAVAEQERLEKEAAKAEKGSHEEEEEGSDSDSSHANSPAASGASSADGSDSDFDGSDYGSSDDDSDSDESSETSSHDMFLLDDDQFDELSRTHLTVERFIDLFNGFNLPDSFIAVFTTNHPEKIHPLITGCNMMDITLDMGMLTEACATEMVEHYFVDQLLPNTTAPMAARHGERHLAPAQAAELHAALKVFNRASHGLSGAVLEKMCIECDTIELLIARVRAVDTWDVTDVF